MADPALIHVRTGRATIVVLGSAQRELWTDSTLPMRVRTSGGGAVLSGPWLLRAAVMLPRSHLLVQHGPVAAARWFGEIHCRWLHARGIRAAALYRGNTVDHWACFAGRVGGEVIIGDRKIVGIAQAWRRETVLLSGGTLIAPAPWRLLCDALRHPPDGAAVLAARTTNAQEYLRGPVDARAWADSLLHALQFAMLQELPRWRVTAKQPDAHAGAPALASGHCIPRFTD